MDQSEIASRRGVFDGFEGYRSPTTADYRTVLTQGLVVPDANVLLNLYRYSAHTREDLFAILQKLGPPLWVPHQTLVEFWKNRESALQEFESVGNDTISALEDQRDQSARALRRWSNRIALA